uniref:site-specific DNA-methyltransferase (adenine-specific) n=1 Tax=Candidatus Kentrum eta TaxID=2126337 RepID=A0A450UXQ1_9GAMM|nr:MAG: type I restriction enzyme M protein [Candidatus Kentron sp. H]VFJ97795.1 MAG: type I restriction enzyme M protein [Candidatus Kentron sp. H]VFK03242.1 MAG: type I restriction enzyme M protein [Candidatus Kentron sp. H]
MVKADLKPDEPELNDRQRMTDKIKQSEINLAAWSACDTFRGVVDPAQYKDYILVMLFLKYISDVWREHYAEYKERFGGDEQRLRRRLERERFLLPYVKYENENMGRQEKFLADFYSLFKRRNIVAIGDLINIVCAEIEEINHVKLKGVFRSVDFNSETNLGKTKDRNRRLRHLLEDFNKPQLDMSPSRVSGDVIGNTYIYLIERFASDAGKKAGEFYTPHAVSGLLAKLARPKPGDCICDPTCGSGGLLVEAAREVENRNFALFGMEVNGSTWALARMNMFLHGMDSARIEWCDALTSPALVENDRLMKFNVVVANPPFSLDKWGYDEAGHDRYNRFFRGIPPKSRGDYAFISHMIEAAIEKGGRVAVVVSHGVLFRGGAEGRIRRRLVEENLLDAVIGLPANLFLTTNIPVAILIFDRTREKGGINEKKNEVMFIDASREYVSVKNQNTLTSEHIEKIVTTYGERRNRDKYANAVTVEEIIRNDCNLSIPRYVDTFEEEEEVDISQAQQTIRELEEELREVRGEMAELLWKLGVKTDSRPDAEGCAARTLPCE